MKNAKSAADVPTVVAERLSIWGAAIRKQRVAMSITADDLCRRLDISRPTLRRLENGEPSAAAAHYLAALNVLGLLGDAAPRLQGFLWEPNHSSPRARSNRTSDGDYF